MSPTEPSPAINTPASRWGGATSMLFWLVLLVAAALYAGVALAPKVLHWQRWQDHYVRQRYQLVEREEQLDALERMVAALDDDPQFVTDLARLEMDTPQPGTESIPVDAALTHDPRQLSTESSVPPPVTNPPSPWEPWLEVLATQSSLRNGMLAAAAILVIAAFTFLHDGSETLRARRENQPETRLTLREFWQQRYVIRGERTRA